jgi:hypothetical protein
MFAATTRSPPRRTGAMSITRAAGDNAHAVFDDDGGVAGVDKAVELGH